MKESDKYCILSRFSSSRFRKDWRKTKRKHSILSSEQDKGTFMNTVNLSKIRSLPIGVKHSSHSHDTTKLAHTIKLERCVKFLNTLPTNNALCHLNLEHKNQPCQQVTTSEQTQINGFMG